MTTLLFSLIAIFSVSFISLSSIFILFLNQKIIQKINLFLVSFAIGALLGDTFIHLLPGSFNNLDSTQVSILIIFELLLFFILEKILRWNHCHEITHSKDESKHLAILNIIGDTIHNLIDGMLITASFMVNTNLGIFTSIAVLLHEIPQEIGDFAILIHSGLTYKKTIIYNLISATFSFVGALIVFFIGSSSFSIYLLPITGGAFIYLAASDLIPELHRHDQKISNSLIQLFCILLGVLLMLLLVFLA